MSWLNSKISDTLLFLFKNKILGIKLLVRTANRDDPDQTASSKAVLSGSSANRDDPDQTASSEAVLSASSLFV